MPPARRLSQTLARCLECVTLLRVFAFAVQRHALHLCRSPASHRVQPLCPRLASPCIELSKFSSPRGAGHPSRFAGGRRTAVSSLRPSRSAAGACMAGIPCTLPASFTLSTNDTTSQAPRRRPFLAPSERRSVPVCRCGHRGPASMPRAR